MKKLYGILLTMFACLYVHGQVLTAKKPATIHWADWQHDFTISLLLEIDDSMNENRISQIKVKLAHLFEEAELIQQKQNQPKKVLEKVFHALFDAHLHNYQALANFPQTIERNEFGCVTGTLLFALTLEKLGFDYTIHETNFHVYLTVQTEEGEILIETTDKKFGFEKNKHLIAKRVKEYELQYETTKQKTKNAYTSLFKIDREIQLTELIGLQYFNKAVIAYNQKDYEKAIKALKQSMQIYDAERGAELMYLTIAQYLKSDELSTEKKDKLIQYQDFYLHKLAAKVQQSH